MKKNLQYGARAIFNTEDVFIVGDVTGDNTKLERLLKKLPLTEHSFLIFVGDLIGQGGESLDVLQTVSHLKRNRKNVYVIKGNHEDVFIKQLEKKIPMIQSASLDWDFLEQFLYLGLHSINPELIKSLLQRLNVLHVLDDLIPYFETKDLLVTHAPLSRYQWKHFKYDKWDVEVGHITGRTYPLEELGPELMWNFCSIEDENLSKMNKYLVCGHQASGFKFSEPRLYEKKCYLDCGVGYRQDKELFAIHFPTKKVYSSV